MGHGIGVFVPETPEGLRQPPSNGSETPVGICIPLSTQEQQSPLTWPESALDRLAVFSA